MPVSIMLVLEVKLTVYVLTTRIYQYCGAYKLPGIFFDVNLTFGSAFNTETEQITVIASTDKKLLNQAGT